MIEHLVFLILAVSAALLLTVYLLHGLTRFTKRSIDEVGEFLCPVNEEELERLLDPQKDLRMRFPALGERRRGQRVRLELFRLYLGRMLHNSIVNQQWSDTEIYDINKHNLEYDAETLEKIGRLNHAARVFTVAARVALGKIWLLCLLRFDEWSFIPVPSVAALRTAGNIDLLEAYRSLKKAAVDMASCHGEEISAEILSLM